MGINITQINRVVETIEVGARCECGGEVKHESKGWHKCDKCGEMKLLGGEFPYIKHIPKTEWAPVGERGKDLPPKE